MLSCDGETPTPISSATGMLMSRARFSARNSLRAMLPPADAHLFHPVAARAGAAPRAPAAPPPAPRDPRSLGVSCPGHLRSGDDGPQPTPRGPRRRRVGRRLGPLGAALVAAPSAGGDPRAAAGSGPEVCAPLLFSRERLGAAALPLLLAAFLPPSERLGVRPHRLRRSRAPGPRARRAISRRSPGACRRASASAPPSDLARSFSFSASGPRTSATIATSPMALTCRSMWSATSRSRAASSGWPFARISSIKSLPRTP